MATDTDSSTGPLSDFGDRQVETIARERAEQIDGRTSSVRYYLEIGLGLISLGAWIVAAVSVLLLAYAFITGGSTSVSWWDPFVNGAIGAVFAQLAKRASNPEPGALA